MTAAALLPATDLDPAALGVERSLSGRRWALRPGDDRAALAIAQRLKVPELVGRVLAARGVTPEAAEAFLNPRLRDAMPDPSVLKDMDRAADRLAHAVQAGEAVAVFGDYDVDGATSAALLSRFLAAAGLPCRHYIPDRLAEGYGPNAAALLRLKAEGISLVVTVDCGVTAFAALAEAKAAGLEVIVIDHHAAEPALPEALAVVNPNRLDEDGALGQLAAVGVAFLLVVAASRALRRAGWWNEARPEPDRLSWLDLVALGTVCDVVPLTGLNRALVAQGLKVMANWQRPGLKALAAVARLDGAPGAFACGWLMGPRVNAGGRVGQADLGVRLLTTEDDAEAQRLALQLDQLNNERRAIEAEVEAEAIAQVERAAAAGDGTCGPLVQAIGEGWHPGVIGVVAGRLTERFRRPSLVITRWQGLGKGSGRSLPGVDLGAAVLAARQAGLLINGGGHAMAAGLTVAPDRAEATCAFIAQRLEKAMASQALVPTLGLDGILAPRGAAIDLIDRLEAAGPYGSGHAEPRFALASMAVVQARRVGAEGRHVSAVLAGSDGGRLRAILWRADAAGLGEILLNARGRPVHVAGKLKADPWQGERRVQLVIDDLAWA